MANRGEQRGGERDVAAGDASVAGGASCALCLELEGCACTVRRRLDGWEVAGGGEKGDGGREARARGEIVAARAEAVVGSARA